MALPAASSPERYRSHPQSSLHRSTTDTRSIRLHASSLFTPFTNHREAEPIAAHHRIDRSHEHAYHATHYPDLDREGWSAIGGEHRYSTIRSGGLPNKIPKGNTRGAASLCSRAINRPDLRGGAVKRGGSITMNRKVATAGAVGALALLVGGGGYAIWQNTAIEVAKREIRDILVDPDSAKFYDVKKCVVSDARTFVVGQVNSRNRVGGMTGKKTFVVESVGGNPQASIADDNNQTKSFADRYLDASIAAKADADCGAIFKAAEKMRDTNTGLFGYPTTMNATAEDDSDLSGLVVENLALLPELQN